MPRPPSEFIPKRWGHEVVITNNNRYCGKILKFAAGKRGSLHLHHIKDETFYLRSGRAIVEIGDTQSVMSAGQVVDVPAGMPHRITAIDDCEFYEFSSPHRDEDTYRLEAAS